MAGSAVFKVLTLRLVLEVSPLGSYFKDCKWIVVHYECDVAWSHSFGAPSVSQCLGFL